MNWLKNDLLNELNNIRLILCLTQWKLCWHLSFMSLKVQWIFKVFLLSEHILCKESIVIFIRFGDSWIHLCYFYVDVCMYLCVYVCMWGNMLASKWYFRLSSDLVCILQVTRRMNPIDFGECRMNSFFTGVQKRFLLYYGL